MNREQKIKIVKAVGGFIVGTGAGMVVRAVLINNMGVPEKLVTRIFVKAGVWGISGVVAMQARNYVHDSVDEFVTEVDKAKVVEVDKAKVVEDDETVSAKVVADGAAAVQNLKPANN